MVTSTIGFGGFASYQTPIAIGTGNDRENAAAPEREF
jgi:hypothetical protein